MTHARVPVRVLIVDDSPVARELISHILSSDPEIHVIGSVYSGRAAIEYIKNDKPDVITMDINMPQMDGFEATRIIMESDPVPIVIVTGMPDMRELETSFRAIEAGALTVLQKPNGIGHPDHAANSKELITMVKLMSEIKVIRRWARRRKKEVGRDVGVNHFAPLQIPPALIKVVAIGASTGGPPVIETVLSALPKEFPAPVLIVQHIATGFIQGFAEWLGQKSILPIHVAFNGSIIRPGHVYIAPDNVQMKAGSDGRLCCTNDKPENGLRPSVSYLFRSVAEVYGKNAAGVLLTGMGRDGAEELKLMKDKGAVTIAQNEESSAVFGMPGEAVRLNAARYILPSDKIAEVLASLVALKTKQN